MAVSYVGRAHALFTTDANSTSSTSFPNISGLNPQTNDLIIVYCVACVSGSWSLVSGTGWTTRTTATSTNNQANIAIYYKFYSSGMSYPTIQFTNTQGNTTNNVVLVLLFRGVNTTTPFDGGGPDDTTYNSNNRVRVPASSGSSTTRFWIAFGAKPRSYYSETLNSLVVDGVSYNITNQVGSGSFGYYAHAMFGYYGYSSPKTSVPTSYFSHTTSPNYYYSFGRFDALKAAATIHDLSGSSTGVGTLSGNPNLIYNLAGSSNGLSSVFAFLTPTKVLTGFVEAVSTSSGILVPVRRLVGVSYGSGELSSTFTPIRTLTSPGSFATSFVGASLMRRVTPLVRTYVVPAENRVLYIWKERSKNIK